MWLLLLLPREGATLCLGWKKEWRAANLKEVEGNVQKGWLELLLLQSHKAGRKVQHKLKFWEKNTHLEIYVVTPAGGEKEKLI